MSGRVLVTGAAGFLGRRLVDLLADRGHEVRAADLEDPRPADLRADEFLRVDLRSRSACDEAVSGVDQVYHLAADTGRRGPFVSSPAAVCRTNTSINLRMLEAAADAGVERLLFPSSARVYAQPRREDGRPRPFAEEDAWPADPEPGHGEEKLYAERLCAHFRTDLGLETRVVRVQEIYGPGGAYTGGEETAIAALCRKVALAADGDAITLWGDGEEILSFLFLDDGCEGLRRLMRSDCPGPVNLASERTATMNELADLVVDASGKEVGVEHDLGKPGGSDGRILDVGRLRSLLDWQPGVGLEEGIARTYRWVEEQVRGTAAAHRHPGPPHIP